TLGRDAAMPCLGKEMGSEPDFSEETARAIDDEIRRIVEDAHERARLLLVDHMDDLHTLSELLIERETLDRDEFERLLAGEDPESVFAEPDDDETVEPEPQGRPEGRPGIAPQPFPLPGALAQGPPPEGSIP
ncbi:MAG: hypothetical protein ACE5EV_08425, partial [Gaiellales bacterium]